METFEAADAQSGKQIESTIRHVNQMEAMGTSIKQQVSQEAAHANATLSSAKLPTDIDVANARFLRCVQKQILLGSLDDVEDPDMQELGDRHAQDTIDYHLQQLLMNRDGYAQSKSDVQECIDEVTSGMQEDDRRLANLLRYLDREKKLLTSSQNPDSQVNLIEAQCYLDQLTAEERATDQVTEQAARERQAHLVNVDSLENSLVHESVSEQALAELQAKLSRLHDQLQRDVPTGELQDIPIPQSEMLDSAAALRGCYGMGWD